MKTRDYLARRFEQAKAINRKHGSPIVRYSIDLDELIPWDFEGETLDEQIDEAQSAVLAQDIYGYSELEDDYSEESFP